MHLLVLADGQVRCLYGEALDLLAIGSLTISRASHVEPDDAAQWWADLEPSSGPRLGPFLCRSAALAAEQTWLEGNRLN